MSVFFVSLKGYGIEWQPEAVRLDSRDIVNLAVRSIAHFANSVPESGINAQRILSVCEYKPPVSAYRYLGSVLCGRSIERRSNSDMCELGISLELTQLSMDGRVLRVSEYAFGHLGKAIDEAEEDEVRRLERVRQSERAARLHSLSSLRPSLDPPVAGAAYRPLRSSGSFTGGAEARLRRMRDDIARERRCRKYSEIALWTLASLGLSYGCFRFSLSAEITESPVDIALAAITGIALLVLLNRIIGLCRDTQEPLCS